MSQNASEGQAIQNEEAAGKEEIENEIVEPIKEDSANNEPQEQGEAGEPQESHEGNEDECKNDSNENIEIREPPVDQPEAKEAVSEIPREESQIADDIAEKVKSSQVAEQNAVENS